MHKLVGEIRSTFFTAEEITFSKIAKLAYLSAVIEESLRMYPPFATSLARVVPPGGASVAGDWIPENVILQTLLYSKTPITISNYLEGSLLTYRDRQS
jgi:cytochrome P450